MAYDERTASRVRQFLSSRTDVTEQKMMGGIVFMVGGHMCCGVSGSDLMVRIGPDARDAALQKPGVKPLDIGGGRQPKAFVCVEQKGFAAEEALAGWVEQALGYVATLPPKS